MPTPRRNPAAQQPTYHMSRGLREGALLIFAAAALFLALALLSYHPADGGWTRDPAPGAAVNAAGRVGALFADVSLFALGYLALALPVLLAYAAWRLYLAARRTHPVTGRSLGIRAVGVALTLGAGSALAALYLPASSFPAGGGGVIGKVLGDITFSAFNDAGSLVLLLALTAVGISFVTGLSWLWVLEGIGIFVTALAVRIIAVVRHHVDRLAGQRAREDRRHALERRTERAQKRPPMRVEPVLKGAEPSIKAPKEQQIVLFDAPAGPTTLPPLSLLDVREARPASVSPEVLKALARRVELKLEEFGIEATVVEVHPGPVITRFELDLAPGVKVSQVTGLAKDVARALSVVSVRVVEIIAGKSTVGLEIPNEQREVISLAETLRSSAYEQSTSPLTLALGKDIQGAPLVADIAKMPHLLVSGTTGSGKSVAINAMVLSLLFKATPQQVRLIMIDPKMLELSVYEGIPHLLCPVVTDMNDAYGALTWCVGEMERRYQRMSALGVRNIASYNRKVLDAAAAGAPIADPLADLSDLEEGDPTPSCTPLPYIVVLVDEFADMMMLVGKKVEQLIARLAQKARASGVHLVLATQRPSVDVITGLIKANIPTRVAFQVSSKIDSRTILDQMGAEQLLGHGDMLYLPPGTSIPTRVHGAFVSDEEVHRVVKHLRAQGRPEYDPEVLRPTLDTGNGGSGGEMPGEGGGGSGEDELYDRAVFLVTSSRRASVSGVQRHLRIGYNRAARLVEEMERAGIVGPLKSNGARDVLAEPPPS